MKQVLLVLLAAVSCAKASHPSEDPTAASPISSSAATPMAPAISIASATIAGGIFAPKRLVSERRKVRYLYREQSGGPYDSGWRVFSGDEDQAYADDPDNFAVFAPTTITAIDPDVAPLLGTPAPCAFERTRATDPFRPAPAPRPPP
jgi:hypothetical protein